jgi:sugar O-acyltransferase (sialic acid O-acetyltransferase NeuD family)
MSGKMRQAVIFGTGAFAEVVKFYLDVDSDYSVAGFTATGDASAADAHLGLPLVDFADVEGRFPPDQFELFVAVGYAGLNSVRQKFIDEARRKGYRLLSYLCSKATHWGGTTIGDNVFIFENNVVQPFVSIGDGTILWSGNHIGHHSAVGPYCFITSHVVVSGHCRIGSHCFLGVNATVTDRTNIGDRNIIGPGSLVQKDTGPDEVYVAERTKKFPKDSSRFFR